MRQKAANRNPDEYYFAMTKGKVDGMSGRNTGRHEKTEEARRQEMIEKGLGDDAVRIMKDQDLAYVRMQRLMDRRKVEKLQSSLHYLEGVGSHRIDEEDGGDSSTGRGVKKIVGKKRKHTLFIEGEEKDVEDFNVAKHFDTIPELMGRSFNRPRIEALERDAMRKLGKKISTKDLEDDYYNDNDDSDEEGNPKKQKMPTEKQLLKQKKSQKRLEKQIARSRSAAYTEMELRNERLAKLQSAEAHLVVEKNCGAKGRKRKVAGKEGGAEDGKPAVYKWRRKRAK